MKQDKLNSRAEVIEKVVTGILFRENVVSVYIPLAGLIASVAIALYSLQY